MRVARMWKSAGLAALLLWGSAAFGQTANPRVTEFLRRGVQLRQQGQDEAALREFQAASRVSPEPRVTAQIALAEQALERWVDADRHLRAALLATQDDYIVRHRAVLESALTEVDRHLGGVLVTGGVAGAEVWISGERVGTMPMREPAWVRPGEVRVEVRAPGHATASRDVTVVERRTSRERITMEPARAALAAANAAEGDRSTREGVLVDVPARTGGSGSAQRTWGWVTLAGGVVFSGVGVTGLMIREGQANDFNDRGCYVVPGSNTVRGPAECVDDYSSVAGPLGIAGLATGGALTVLSVVLLATAPSRTSEPHARAVSFACGQGPGQFGVACGGTF